MSTKELSNLADVECKVEPQEEEAILHNTELQHIYFILHMSLLSSLFLSFVLICATGVQLIEATPRTREKAGTGTDERTTMSAKVVSRCKAA